MCRNRGPIFIPQPDQHVRFSRAEFRHGWAGTCQDLAVASIQKTENGRYRARYRDSSGKEHLKRFALKRDAQRWLDQETTKRETGTWVAPRTAKTTVGQWCDVWLANYGTRKASTVRMAGVHVTKIKEEFGNRRLDSIRPSEVRAWLVSLKEEGYAASYISALHQRMAQVYSDAVHDGLVARSPLSRRTSPGQGKQPPYVATTAQIWALHDAMEPRYRAGLLLAAFAGLRLAEVCGLRVQDVDFLRGVVHPVQQYPAEPLKTETSRTPVPIPQDLVLELSAHVEDFSTTWIMCDEAGRQMGPWQLQRAFRAARAEVPGLPEGFRFHDLRHFYASLLIASGLDVKVVQARLRHASAKTTLDTYGHLWPDSDETTRAAISSVMTTRNQNPAATVRPSVAVVQHIS
jgi:integrase